MAGIARRRRGWITALILIAIVAAIVASQGGGGGGNKTSSGRHRNPTTPQRPREAGVLAPARSRARLSRICPPPARVLHGIYHPERLVVLDGCRRARGTVVKVRVEDDGDLHFDVRVDRRYRHLLRSGNAAAQGGALVVEFTPRDHGHLPRPAVGDRISLIGAWVEDAEHAWNEFHPVWAVSINGGRWHVSGPRFGGSPPEDRSYNALAGCRTTGGLRCRGYGGRGGSVPPSPTAPGSDKDCSDFSTQAQAQRYFESKGGPARDPDRLDSDHDGRACDSLP